MNKNMVWIMALMMAMLSCKGRQNEANAQVADALYAETQSQQAEQKKARNEKIRGEKAKTVRMYEIPAPLRDRPEQILYRAGYTTSYNSKSKTPNWVAWHLTERHTRGEARRNMQVFTEDSDIIGKRATNNDYYNSRYDRGHMCPAGDNKWSEEAMRQTFLFTNIFQGHSLSPGQGESHRIHLSQRGQETADGGCRAHGGRDREADADGLFPRVG